MRLRELFGLCMIPSFEEGERILAQLPWAMVSTKALPSWRVNFPMPPFVDIGVVVTDRRVMLVAHLFRLFRQQFSLWYEGYSPSGDQDTVREANVGENRWGIYLELFSETETAQLMRTKELRTRIYTRKAYHLAELISSSQKATR